MVRILALASLVIFVPVAHADLQCMARTGGTWNTWFPNGSEIAAGTCTQSLTYFSFAPVRYRLKSGPIRSDGRITCQWTRDQSDGSTMDSGSSAPDSIICNLFL